MAISVRAAKDLVSAFRSAVKILDGMPELPSGLTPQSVRVIDAVHEAAVAKGAVRVSDVARALGTSRPGITRQLNSLERLGYVAKCADAADGRAVNVELTALGADFFERFVRRRFEQLAADLDGFSEEEVAETANTIRRIDAALAGRRAERMEG